MRGGPLPPALIAAALGLALAYAPPKARVPAILVFCLAASAMTLLALDAGIIEFVYLGCWASVIACAVSVHFPKWLQFRLVLGLALVSGGTAGAVLSLSGTSSDLLIALPCILTVVPAAWLVATSRGIVVKIVSSWLIAIALLSAALPLTPTPGYEPDHME